MSRAIFSAKLDMAHSDVQLVWRRLNSGGLDEVDEVIIKCKGVHTNVFTT